MAQEAEFFEQIQRPVATISRLGIKPTRSPLFDAMWRIRAQPTGLSVEAVLQDHVGTGDSLRRSSPGKSGTGSSARPFGKEQSRRHERELTKIGEREIHEVLLSCTRSARIVARSCYQRVRAVAYPAPVRIKPGPLFPSRAD
jgi:hypothetical protein